MPTLITFLQHCIASPSHGDQATKERKLTLIANDMISNIENPKVATKKLIELINKCTKVAGYKINIQNLWCFYILIMN